MRRRRPPRRHAPQDPLSFRIRLLSFRVRSPFGIGSLTGMGRGVILPEMSGTEIPEPDEELPDSDLPDSERLEAIERERWRRDGRV
ncbi:MAG TPA: hypothetical protein VNN10_05100 [Dehalococcoidia bacterium]|nr:hypothetical protein [Dehalococcoidia bacterium]